MVDTQRVNYRELFKRIAMTVVWKKLTSSVHSGIVLKMLTRAWQLYFVNMSDEHMLWYMLSATVPCKHTGFNSMTKATNFNITHEVYSPNAPWCWNIYLQNWAILWGFYVDIPWKGSIWAFGSPKCDLVESAPARGTENAPVGNLQCQEKGSNDPHSQSKATCTTYLIFSNYN